MKQCNTCKTEKKESEFYARQSKCKSCYKKAASDYRGKNLEKIRAYDRERGNRQEPGYLKEYREKYPNKYKAHNMVNNAVRDGKLFSLPCEVCISTNDLHAHHDDYLKPLNVRWLCVTHHSEWHKKNGEGKNP
jgi:hypothetical protein